MTIKMLIADDFTFIMVVGSTKQLVRYLQIRIEIYFQMPVNPIPVLSKILFLKKKVFRGFHTTQIGKSDVNVSVADEEKEF